MKTKLIIVFLLVGAIAIGGYFYYNHNYVKTLMLSEIVGKPENDFVRLLVNLGDFDTGLTRHDLSQLYSKKDYWLKRINEVDNIIDPNIQAKESEKLLAEMMDDQAIKKIIKGSFTQTSEFIKEILR